MESALGAVIIGAVMILLGTVRGLWDELVDGLAVGISNFTAALRGAPAHGIAAPRTDRRREPLVALIGVAVTLIGFLAQISN